jgi:hypothetical protein
MAEPNRMKVRTLIMVVSMVILPVAAVIGVKVPGFLRVTGAWSRDAAETASKTKPLAASRGSKSNEAKDRGLVASAGQSPKPPQPESPSYPVVRVGNIDVRPEEPQIMRLADGDDVPTPLAAVAANHVEASPNDLFLQVQQRLRALGATHYSLETWGTTGEAYRFQCRMAAGHDLNYSRHFEATDTDALRVMQTVLEEVEAWKAGRLP